MDFDLDAFINRLLKPDKNKRIIISQGEIENLCNVTKKSFLEQAILLNIKGPLKICGDIHGQFFDLLKLFEIGGCPTSTRYLFLGDYVDRGRNSLETICLLLALKCKYPESFFLIRGNHELAPINRLFGFYREIKRRFRQKDVMKLYLKLNEVFNYMPLAAVLDNSVFCCHGGLSPLLKNIRCIESIVRPVPPRKTGLVADLLWSDPSNDINEWDKRNSRGIGCSWGKTAHENFLKTNKLKMVIRGHECVENGFLWAFDNKLITIFSAPNYSEGNFAAIASYQNDFTIDFVKFK